MCSYSCRRQFLAATWFLIDFETRVATSRSGPVLDCMQHYLANDQQLRRYVPIIRDSLVFPVVYDSARTLLSLPPIINSRHSQVR